MIERRFVEQYARGARVSLDVAEREITLTYALAWLNDHQLLGHAAFKGGTFLRKMIFGSTGRFSEDLDFVYTSDDWEQWLGAIEAACATPYHGVRFTMADWYVTASSLGLEMEYSHGLASVGHFSLDVSIRGPLILPTVDLAPIDQAYFRRLPFQIPQVRCVNLVEAWAEKIRASYERTKPRDLLDLFLLGARAVDARLLRRLAVLKVWTDRKIFRPEDLFVHWVDCREEWPSLERLTRSLVPFAQVLALCQDRYQFMIDLDPLEHELAEDAYCRSPAADRAISEAQRWGIA